MMGFYGPVSNEVMSNLSVNSGTVPGQAFFWLSLPGDNRVTDEALLAETT